MKVLNCSCRVWQRPLISFQRCSFFLPFSDRKPLTEFERQVLFSIELDIATWFPFLWNSNKKDTCTSTCITFLKENTGPSLSLFPSWWPACRCGAGERVLSRQVMEGSHPPTVDLPLTYGLSCEKICFAGATAYFGAFCYSSLAWSLTNPSGLTWSGYDNGLFCAHVTEKFSGNPAVPIYTKRWPNKLF